MKNELNKLKRHVNKNLLKEERCDNCKYKYSDKREEWCCYNISEPKYDTCSLYAKRTSKQYFDDLISLIKYTNHKPYWKKK
jgi:hypothetical protein